MSYSRFLGYKSETLGASSVVKNMNAYHDLEDLNMQEWEDLCQHQPISSRAVEALLEDIISEVDKTCIAACHPSQKKEKYFVCTHCQKWFTRKFYLERHMKKHMGKRLWMWCLFKNVLPQR